MKYYGIRKREKQKAIALKDAETEGLPSTNAIGTLQTNGKVTSLQKVLTLPLIHYWHSQKIFLQKLDTNEFFYTFD